MRWSVTLLVGFVLSLSVQAFWIGQPSTNRRNHINIRSRRNSASVVVLWKYRKRSEDDAGRPFTQPIRWIARTNHAESRSAGDGTLSPSHEELFLLRTERMFTTPMQKRMPAKRHRRPRGYWSNVTNMKRELKAFWNDLGVTLSEGEPPPVPNVALLNYCDRHDLKSAIMTRGSAQVAMNLGGARVVPGPWKNAVETSPELRQILLRQYRQRQQQQQLESSSPSSNIPHLRLTVPPLEAHRKRKLQSKFNSSLSTESSTDNDDENDDDSTRRRKRKRIDLSSVEGTNDLKADVLDEWRYNNATRHWSHSPKRRPSGYWTKHGGISLVKKELYGYLEWRFQTSGTPQVWMPRPSEISNSGRDDLASAMVRYGGASHICQCAGLVPHKEWTFFETQYELLLRLVSYLDQYHANENYIYFPGLKDIRANKHDRLFYLIHQFGGRKLLACRFGMSLTSNMGPDGTPTSQSPVLLEEMNWGPFSLVFAIQLLHHVRETHLSLRPPLQVAHTIMPTPSQLLLEETRGEELARQVDEFGGYESVARRLGLAFIPEGLSVPPQ